MDALTARKMSTMGLNATKPLLPPVQNLGMIYLKEPLTDADEDLYNARLALKKLEEAQQRKADTESLELDLHVAMEKLQGKEREYFARRYVSRNKQVLHGWQNRLTLFLQEILHTTQQKLDRSDNNRALHEDTVEALHVAFDMSKRASQMNEMCLAQNGSRLHNPVLVEVLQGDLVDLEREKTQIHGFLVTTRQRADNGDDVEVDLEYIKEAHIVAKILTYVANNMINNEWDLSGINAYIDTLNS